MAPPAPKKSASPRPRAEAPLGTRALNRALLERQLLLRRVKLTVGAALERLVGLQAQSPNAPYYGLWSRLEGFHQDDLAKLLTERLAVRLPLMRSTVHLVTAADCLALRPVLQPALERALFVGTSHGKDLRGMDLGPLVAAGRALVEERPRTNVELREVLAEHWPGRDVDSLIYAIRTLLPLVQVTPRGIWGVGGQAASTTAEAWLGRPLGGDRTPDRMIERYLAAFGPATAKDAQTWSGLPPVTVREALERLSPRLRTFRDERGQPLFDVPRGPLPDPETPAPPRFLPEVDNAVLAHADRARIIAEEDRPKIAAKNGMLPTLLVDGFVQGTWKLERTRAAATLTVTPFTPLKKRERSEVTAEGERLLAFAAADAKTRQVRFAAKSA